MKKTVIKLNARESKRFAKRVTGRARKPTARMKRAMKAHAKSVEDEEYPLDSHAPHSGQAM